MEFYMEPVINMFEHLKIKILKAGFKRTAQFWQIIIKNVFLTHLSQFKPTIANKTKEKKYLSTFFWDTLYYGNLGCGVHILIGILIWSMNKQIRHSII